LPESGTVLEIASGSGEHAVYFAERFPQVQWQPSDADRAALDSITAWRADAGLHNIAAPLHLDVAGTWPDVHADAILCINMAHISPWTATLALLDQARALLANGGPLIFYGPWLQHDVNTAPSNLDFDSQLRRRDPRWGIRFVEDLSAAAEPLGFRLVDRRAMPANNLMLLLRREIESR
jgi:hypothetical protein